MNPLIVIKETIMTDWDGMVYRRWEFFTHGGTYRFAFFNRGHPYVYDKVLAIRLAEEIFERNKSVICMAALSQYRAVKTDQPDREAGIGSPAS